MSIDYINDKTRMYVYDILFTHKQRKLCRSERKEFDLLKHKRVWDESERGEILNDLFKKGYVSKPKGDIVKKNGDLLMHGSINIIELNITVLGEELLQKGLHSELKESRYKKRMEWLDRFVNFKFITGAIAGILLQEILSLLKGLLEWITKLLYT